MLNKALIFLSLTPSAHIAQTPEQISYQSIDGLEITADLYETGDRSGPIVFAFHQSGSSRGEYRDIAPRLVDLGFNVLAVDLRWGATDRWNRVVNETAVRFGTDQIVEEAEAGDRSRVWPTIFEAYNDMLASMDWASTSGFDGLRLVIGSSFSAMIVMKLPQDRRVDAVVSYSPGEYYSDDSTLVSRWAGEIGVPTYIGAGSDERELSQPVFRAVRTQRKTLHVAEVGRHGASILLEDERNFQNLERFLSAFRPPEQVSFTTGDGITVFGDNYSQAETPRGTIMLFHQGGGSSRGEYRELAPRLIENDFNLLAIDQRRGGTRLGSSNRTVVGAGEAEFSYCDAYPDLEAALDFVETRAPGATIIAWGSSYSAALVMKLAALNEDRVSRVLAFSPASGEAMEGCESGDYAVALKNPLIALRPASEMHFDAVRDQLTEFADQGHQTFVARNGVHGSSMLNTRRVGRDTEDTWQVVLQFLSGSHEAPEALIGEFEDDYGERYSVTQHSWSGPGSATMEIVSWDAENRSLLLRNDPEDASYSGMWTRIDWVELDEMPPFEWAYCFTTYDAESLQEAAVATPADRENPRTGCNGFPFSRMKQR